MPKVSIHKDRNLDHWENQVGLAGNAGMVQPVSDTESVKRSAQGDLARGVPAANCRHVAGDCRRVPGSIGHLLKDKLWIWVRMCSSGAVKPRL